MYHFAAIGTYSTYFHELWNLLAGKAGVLFLQKNDALVSLYSFLGCKSLTDIEVYCQFIFEHFEYLSEAARVIHLTYIRDRWVVSLLL